MSNDQRALKFITADDAGQFVNLFIKEEEARQYEMDAGSAKADLEEYKSKYLDKQTYVMTVLEPIITCLRDDFKVDSKKLKTLLTDDQYKCFME